MSEKHMCFTVGQTNSGHWAIFFQAAPEKTATGVNLSLRFPAFIASEWLDQPQADLEKIAKILNERDQ